MNSNEIEPSTFEGTLEQLINVAVNTKAQIKKKKVISILSHPKQRAFFMDLNTTQKLDEVLFFLKTNKIWVYHQGGSSIEFPRINDDISEGDTELIRILRKLVSDEYVYITHETDSECYSITFDGFIFYGYGKKEIFDNEQIFRISRVETDQKNYNRQLLWATWFAGIAGVLVLLWQVFEYFYPVHANYPYWIWETIPK